MVRDFIMKMRDDNEQKIHSLETELSELVRDLSCAEKLLEKMLREKKSDSYIFSPRAMDFQIDEKIRKQQSNIRELNQKIEYVRHTMEERLKNQDEYDKLLNEIERSEFDDQNSSTEDTDILISENNSAIRPEMDHHIQEQDSAMDLSETSDVIEINKEQLFTFVEKIYKETESCLAIINGNKNRCKSELRSMMKTINEFKKMIETDDVS